MTTITEDTTVDSLTSIIESFNTITDTITLFKMQLSTLQQQVKTVEKRVCKELKTAKKNGTRYSRFNSAILARREDSLAKWWNVKEA